MNFETVPPTLQSDWVELKSRSLTFADSDFSASIGLGEIEIWVKVVGLHRVAVLQSDWVELKW